MVCECIDTVGYIKQHLKVKCMYVKICLTNTEREEVDFQIFRYHLFTCHRNYLSRKRWTEPVLRCSCSMMTSSNGNIFRVTGPLCGEFTCPRGIPRTKASDAELQFFFDLRPNKLLSKQSWGWWIETPSHPLWRHLNGAIFWLPASYEEIYLFHSQRRRFTCENHWRMASLLTTWLFFTPGSLFTNMVSL